MLMLMRLVLFFVFAVAVAAGWVCHRSGGSLLVSCLLSCLVSVSVDMAVKCSVV